MRKTLILLPLAALAASPAFAQTPPRGPDANGDGIVTRAEETAEADRRFAATDTDHDGIVTPEERRAEHERMRAERQARGGPDARPGAGRMPGDQRPDGPGPRGPRRGPDGMRPEPRSETAAEFRAHALERFDRIDTNHDGQIDAAERAAARGRMGPPPPPPGDAPPPADAPPPPAN